MPLSFDDLQSDVNESGQKREALQEISNIGVGHAATALSQLLNRKVNMSVPRLNVVKLQDVCTELASDKNELMAGVYIQTKENTEATFSLLLLFDTDSIINLLSILRKSPEGIHLDALDDISTSIIKETGNILLLHTITAINAFTESHWFPSTAKLILDKIERIIDEIITSNVKTTEILLVECDIFPEDGSKMKGNILLLPNAVAMNLLMTRLYGESWENE